MIQLLACAVLLASSNTDPATGRWRAWLDSPGGELPFALEITAREGGLTSALANGGERVEVPLLRDPDGALRFDFPDWDARIVARASADGRALDGEWTRAATGGATRRLAFHARAGDAPRFAPLEGPAPDPSRVAGRWAVRFERDEHPAVAVLRAEGQAVAGTFLTATGDHRYLEGSFQAGRLRLSCFDGTHAFLYDARLQDDGSLRGTFWSGDAWHEGWSARRDDAARLADEFALARWSDDPGLGWISGTDLDGRERTLAELLFSGRALVLQVAGSWCPNCHDELAWLAPLAERLAPKGLQVVTLGFEVSGERERDLRQLRRMRERHAAQHPFLLCGVAERERAAAALGALQGTLAFPTLVVLGRDGRARAVHAGFTGPAAGAEHAALLRELEQRIGTALDEPDAASPALELLLAERAWRDERDRTLIELARGGDGRVTFVEHELTRFDGPTRLEPVAQGVVEARGACVRIGATLWQVDVRTKSALDPLDLGHRLTPSARGPFPYLDTAARDAPEAVLAGLSDREPRLRRESAWFLARQIVIAMFAPPDEAPRVDPSSASNLLPLLDDADPLVRATACWACGLLRLEPAREKLAANAQHPFPAVRREAARALRALQAGERR